MRIAGFAFEPRLVPTVAAVVMVALTASLGRWQTHRAEEKAARQALLEARLRESPLSLTGPVERADEIVFRRVRAEGSYVPEGQIFIDNRVYGMQAGFQVMTPLALRGSPALVLVNRGWIARTAAYPAPPVVSVPPGDQVVHGIATVPPARVLELSPDTVSGSVWQNLSIARYAAKVGRPVLPIVILATPPGPGLVAIDERPDAGIERHREYMLTWYSLAVTVAALWLGLNLRRAGP